MNRTEQGIARYLGEERLRRLQSVVIGIAGAGGLGSNCAMHLVRCGFKRFVIADHDTVEPSNLNRQSFWGRQVGTYKVHSLAQNMMDVNRDLDLKLYCGKVDGENALELFGGCHAVVECFDEASCKKALVETLLPVGIFLVAASGIAGHGRADDIVTRRMSANFVLVGDMTTECSEDTPPFSPMVGLAAAKQADAVLSHFLERFEEDSHV